MGLEARCTCRVNDGSGEVRALLESHELILRGEVKRKFPIASITQVRVDGGDLRFEAEKEKVALELGAVVAERWAKKLAAPPRTLAQKLGIGSSSKALVIGAVEDPALRDALAGSETAKPAEAKLSLAVVVDAVALDHALQVHATLPSGAAIWIVYRKGSDSAFGEAAVRRIMRQAGYIDSKVSAVSDSFSATRYGRRI
jgi:hypothetical protein